MTTASTPTAPAHVARKSRPLPRSRDQSLCRRLVDLIATPHHRGPIDRRWELANAVVSRAATPRFFRGQIDPAIMQAIRYLKLRHKNRPAVRDSFPNVSEAFRLRFHADRLTRSVLEARLLSGESIADTVAKCNLPIDVIKWYRLLFFDVHERLQHRQFIFNNAIGPRYRSGFTEDDVDIILKSLAYLKGPMFLDYLLPFFTTEWHIPDRLDGLTVDQLEQLRYMASTKAMIVAMTMPAEKAVPAYERLLAGEQATQWEGLAGELKDLIAIEAGVKTVVSASLSQAWMMHMIDSFAVAPAAAKPVDEVEEPVAMAG